MYEKVSNNPAIQANYEQYRKEGTCHSLAEMFAFRQAPYGNTDCTFLAERENGRQFQDTPWLGDKYKRRAEADGVDVTGKVYLGQLAEYPGDPKAWVNSRDDVRRVCEERGWGCEGMVDVKGQQKTFGDGPAVDPALVEEHAIAACESDPALAERAARGGFSEIKAETLERIKPHWAE